MNVFLVPSNAECRNAMGWTDCAQLLQQPFVGFLWSLKIVLTKDKTRLPDDFVLSEYLRWLQILFGGI